MKKGKCKFSLYIKLLACSLIITGSACLIPTNSPFFTIVAGVGCGGIASVVVAWLIDIAKSRIKDIDHAEKWMVIYSPLFAQLMSFVDTYAVVYTWIFEENTKDDCHKWLEWRSLLRERLKEVKHDGKQWRRFKEKFADAFADLAQEMDRIECNRVLLLSNDYIENKTFCEMTMLRSHMETCIFAIEDDTKLNPGEYICEFADHLYEFIEMTPYICSLNHVEFRAYDRDAQLKELQRSIESGEGY